MGIYDRDYYRDNSGHRNPFDSRIQACAALVAIYVAVFVVQISTREDGIRGRPSSVTELLELKASKVLEGEVWRIATYAFAHDPRYIAPIAFNILFLIWFGRHVEEIYGWKEFLAFYLAAGILAGIGFVLFAVVSQTDSVAIGPAGSITATLVLLALHDPKRTVLVFFLLPVPIWLVVAFHVSNDALGFFAGRVHPAAFAAHAVAGLFAFAYHRYSWRISNWLPGLPARGTRKRRAKTSLQIFRGETSEEPPPRPQAVPVVAPVPATVAVPANAAPSQTEMDEQLEAQLDEVLEKVKKDGQASLNEEQRAVLFRASEIYRKRRAGRG